MANTIKSRAAEPKLTTVQADISAAALAHAQQIAASEFRSVRKQFSKIIEDWHDANTARPSARN